MIKTLLAAVVAGTFLMSIPVHAADPAPAAGEKAEKPKKDKKKDAAKSDKKDEKAAGGW